MSCVATYYNIVLIALILINHLLNISLCKVLNIQSSQLKSDIRTYIACFIFLAMFAYFSYEIDLEGKNCGIILPYQFILLLITSYVFSYLINQNIILIKIFNDIRHQFIQSMNDELESV